MRLIDLILISLRTLAKNKLRSGLTVLGVVIGIAAVTTMVSLGQGAGQLVQDQFQALGSNVIVVLPGNSQSGGVRSGNGDRRSPTADADAIAAECPAVLAVSPLIGTSGQVIGGNINWQPDQMFGVGTDYPVVRNWPMASGEFFSRKRHCRGEQGLRARPHRGPAAVSRTPIRWGSRCASRTSPSPSSACWRAKGANMVGQDQDDILLMPYTTVRKRSAKLGVRQRRSGASSPPGAKACRHVPSRKSARC